MTDSPTSAEHELDAADPSAYATPPLSDDQEWDERYSSGDQVWSGEPNGALMAEVQYLQPGRALDVGCGEGADAIWLASVGWQVTALDVSKVALRRASTAATKSRIQVRWMHTGLLEAQLHPGAFDLVSAQYPALRRTPTQAAERALMDAVAPEGLLLVVHHADVDAEVAKSHGFDPADYVNPGDVAALLGEDWQIALDERRPRSVRTGAGAHHTHDVVLHARRVGSAIIN